MEIRRFYVDKQDIDGVDITIKGDEFCHLTKVLRHKVGFQIIVCNNFDGKDYYAEIVAINKECASAIVEKVVDNESQTKRNFVLYQALPKGDKSDLIVQKAVELGVSQIVFFNSDNVEERKINIERLQRIAIESCKQCGRSIVPTVVGAIEFEELLENISYSSIFCYEKEGRSSFVDISAENFEKSNCIGIIVGAEGGFTDDEAYKISRKGAMAVSLGKRILRCETAAISAITLVMYIMGEMTL